MERSRNRSGNSSDCVDGRDNGGGPAGSRNQLGNASLCIVFGLIDEIGKGKNIWIRILGIAAASVTKFLFISTSARCLLTLPPPAAKVMGSPQLFTALAGGALACWSPGSSQNRGYYG